MKAAAGIKLCQKSASFLPKDELWVWQKNAIQAMWYAARKHIICCMGSKYRINSSKDKIVTTF